MYSICDYVLKKDIQYLTDHLDEVDEHIHDVVYFIALHNIHQLVGWLNQYRPEWIQRLVNMSAMYGSITTLRNAIVSGDIQLLEGDGYHRPLGLAAMCGQYGSCDVLAAAALAKFTQEGFLEWLNKEDGMNMSALDYAKMYNNDDIAVAILKYEEISKEEITTY